MTCSLTVVGLGYVGLPLAREACRSGLKVTGFDTDAGLVESLATGSSHIDDLTTAWFLGSDERICEDSTPAQCWNHSTVTQNPKGGVACCFNGHMEPGIQIQSKSHGTCL